MERGNVLIRFADVTKTYRDGQIVVMKDFSFDFLAGETHVICGRSGAGKSTLIRCINYLERIDAGKILVEGTEVNARSARTIRKKIAMVFQDFNLFPHMSVLRNVAFGPIHSLKVDRREAEEGAEAYLAKVGLSDKIHAYPHELSGGQKQRVAIARALNLRPDMILFDEPTSALDPEMVGEVIEIMKQLSREGMSMIVVTHEMGFAREAAHRISFMEDGTFLETTDPDTFFTCPGHPSVARFIRQISRGQQSAEPAP